MRFYIDVEAQRFSNYIISIGVSASNGNTFYSLVKPHGRKKIDNFIVELTGITNEMLADAPTADEVFCDIYNFIKENSNNEVPQYYVYGDSDKTFFEATIKHMKNPTAIICAQAISGTLIDFAETVRKFFVVKTDLALRKVYMLIQASNELVQNHNALEDAKMLQVVVENLERKCKPSDKDTILAIPSQKKPSIKKAPSIFIKWNKQSKWNAETGADENNYMVKAIDQHSGDTIYFNSLDVAALWAIKFIARNVSPKNTESVNKIKGAISSATQTNKCKYNCYWEYNPEGAISAAAKETENEG